MKLAASIACLAFLAVGAAAPAAGAATRHCSSYYYKPQYKRVTSITIAGGSCATAHGIVLAYENAITSSYGSSGSRTGVCFGAHSFGRCDIKYRGRKYACNRPVASGSAVPATCTRKDLHLRFRG